MTVSELRQIESEKSSNKSEFLKGNDEFYMISIPIAGVFISVIFWGLGVFDISWEVGPLALFVSSLILMEWSHIIFSFVLFFSLPELKEWRESKDTVAKSGWMRGYGPTARLVIIGAVLTVMCYFLQISDMTRTLPGVISIILFLELLGPTQHAVAQMRGISLCYNSNIKNNITFSALEVKQAATCENIERKLFNLLLAGEIFYWLPPVFNLGHINIPGLEISRTVGAVAIIASSAGLIINALYFPHHKTTRKFLFLTRVILYPMTMLSPVGIVNRRLGHGTEYLMIFRRMINGSRIEKKKVRKIYFLAISLSIIYILMLSPTYMDFAIEDYFPTILKSMIVVTIVLRYAHYYMDSIMFKMSHAATRNIIGPLLVGVTNDTHTNYSENGKGS